MRTDAAVSFRTSDEAIDLAAIAGFDFQEAYSCLLTPPETVDGTAQPREGIVPDAGYVAMAFTKCRGIER